ncbi:MAG TPA: hypothetical protein VGN37_19265 [Actinocatenispora sp.]
MFVNPVRAVGWLIISILLTVIFTGVGINQAHTYFDGETVTAHVDRCSTHRVYSRHGSHNETDCYGSWTTADGQKHDGEIPGAGAGDENTDVKLRAIGDDVVEDSEIGALWPFIVAVIGLGLTVGAIFAVRHAVRKRREMRAGFAGPPPGYQQHRPPTQYGPPPPPQQQYGGPPQHGAPQYGAPQYGNPPAYGPPQYGPPPGGYPPPQGGYPPPGYPRQQGGYPRT